MPTFRHQMPAQIRFCDIDRFGHVNNSVYFQLYDMGKTAYFMDVVGKDVFDKIAIVVAHIDADFLSAVHETEPISIQTCITHLGNKSLTLLQRALNTDTGEVKCQCTTVMVAYDTETNQSMLIPQYIKDLINAYEENTDNTNSAGS